MNVVIIGNPSTNGDRIKELATSLSEGGVNVRYPTIDALDTTEDASIIETFERIDWSNFVIAVPKEGLAFSAKTTSELAYAKHCKKPVLIYYE